MGQFVVVEPGQSGRPDPSTPGTRARARTDAAVSLALVATIEDGDDDFVGCTRSMRIRGGCMPKSRMSNVELGRRGAPRGRRPWRPSTSPPRGLLVAYAAERHLAADHVMAVADRCRGSR